MSAIQILKFGNGFLNNVLWHFYVYWLILRNFVSPSLNQFAIFINLEINKINQDITFYRANFVALHGNVWQSCIVQVGIVALHFSRCKTIFFIRIYDTFLHVTPTWLKFFMKFIWLYLKCNTLEIKWRYKLRSNDKRKKSTLYTLSSMKSVDIYRFKCSFKISPTKTEK